MGDLGLAALAHRQLGLVTRRQALAHLSRKTVEFRLASRRLEVVRRGVYRFAGSPAVPGHAQLAACLTAGPSAVASHRAAAELFEMPGLRSDGPELTVAWPQWPRLPGVTSHQTRHLPTSHWAMVGPVPVTSPARTLADLAPSLGAGFLSRLVDSSLRRRITDLPGLRAVEDLLRVPPLRQVLDARAPDYHPGDSDREVDLARVLDLAYPDVRLGVEYHGWDFHRTRRSFDHDRRRGNALALAGWTVLSFTSASDGRETATTTVAAYERAARAFPPSAGDSRDRSDGVPPR